MKLINLFGGPGCGKSAIAAGVFSAMKAKHINAELITEYAKDLVYSETLSVLKKHQPFIFAEQNRRQAILKGKVEWAITDSPLLLSHFYGKVGGFEEEAFLNLVSDTWDTYDNVSIFLDRPDQFQEGGRDRNLQESIQIDEALLQILKDHYVNYIRIKTDEHTVGKILSHLCV